MLRIGAAGIVPVKECLPAFLRLKQGYLRNGLGWRDGNGLKESLPMSEQTLYGRIVEERGRIATRNGK